MPPETNDSAALSVSSAATLVALDAAMVDSVSPCATTWVVVPTSSAVPAVQRPGTFSLPTSICAAGEPAPGGGPTDWASEFSVSPVWVMALATFSTAPPA